MTGRDVVTAALKLIGSIAPGESLAASEATDGLAVLNRMISSWSTESLLIHSRVRDTLTLVAGTQSYTMGTGGTFNTSRPVMIEEAAIRDATQTPAAEYPVRILSLAQWQSIVAKAAESEIPTDLFAEGTYPLETLNIYPKPTAAHTLVIWSRKVLSAITTLDTAISLPPGYEEALIYNLCVRLAPEYGRALSAEVVGIAQESKAAIKRANHKPQYLTVDNALRSGGGFNILTGGFN